MIYVQNWTNIVIIYANMPRQIHVNNRDDAKLKGLATELSLSPRQLASSRVNFSPGINWINFQFQPVLLLEAEKVLKKLRFFYTSEKNLTNFAPKLNVLQIFLNQKRKTGTGSKKLAVFASKTQFFP